MRKYDSSRTILNLLMEALLTKKNSELEVPKRD
jgi:hypothetical protein